METSAQLINKQLAERRFYTGMALAMLVSVFVGFSRSFFLRSLFPGHPSPSEPIFYFHGVVFTAWILLFVLQVSFIAKGKVHWHRKIGPYGGALVPVMVVLGIWGALVAGGRPEGFNNIPIPGLQFLAVPFFDMLLFPAFVCLALLKRHDFQSHKRLMLLATLNLITAAIARWPVVETLGPLAFFGITDLFILALAVWDKRSDGRIHPVTLWGGLLIIISQPLRLFISSTGLWMTFAEWATGILR
jgi:uncharacterized membrane protein YozB (DUF420 family)